jgi:peptidoglycan/LPS O-acetylase OafA/YrhL
VTATEQRPAATAAADRPDHSEFPALDGLRALAVTAVVGTHCAYWTYRYGRGAGQGLLARLDSGVAIFFVLSGFLLSRPWLIAAATHRAGPQLRVYFWRRALRILPAYWVTVLIAFATLHDNRSVDGADFLRHALLVQIYHLGWLRAGLTQSWSLCTEAAFYLLLPLLGAGCLWWTRRFGWRPAALLVGCAALTAATICWYLWIHSNGWSAFTSANYWLPGYLSWFAGGIAMAIVQVHLQYGRPGPRWRLADQLGNSPGVCWTAAGAVFVIAATPLTGPRTVGLISTGEALCRNLLYITMAMLIVWPAVFGDRRWASLVFGNPPLRWLGRISYSIFLLHLVLLEAGMNVLGYRLFTGSAGTLFMFTMTTSIVAATISYRLIERPAMAMRHLVPARRRTQLAPQPPPAR